MHASSNLNRCQAGQHENAQPPICTPSAILTILSPLQYLNATKPIRTPSAISTTFKPVRKTEMQYLQYALP